MKTKIGKTIRGLLVTTAALAAVTAFTPAAWAGCGLNSIKKPSSWQATPDFQGMLIPANFGDFRQSPIVGMWSVNFVLPGGGSFDFGYQVWHGDGTEIMNSGSRAPATENFCMGVWEQTGPLSYKLNHLALSYDKTSGLMNARVDIRENVVVDPKGGTFSGAFTADIYGPAGGGAPLQHLAGHIVGQRVTVNTTP